MLTREDNELVTNTNAGTPMGELFRRFWLPVALAEELPGPDCVPLRSTHGYAVALTRVLKLLSAGSDGMSTHWPEQSNFQPW